MIISGLQNKNNLEVLKSNSDIKVLKIENLNLDEDWSLISEAKNLENLTIRDSHIDYKNFYLAICSLKNLKELTYNHYCFFNKNKKDKFSKNLCLPSLKIFRIEFPEILEPDFEINSYWHKSYRQKYNSITELQNSYKIFNNLQKIEFINYQTYRNRVLNGDRSEDIKKLNSEIYWNMSFKTLNQFKELNEILIDNGNFSDVIASGFLNIPTKHFDKIKFKINGLSFSEILLKLNEVKNISIVSKKEDSKVPLAYKKVDTNIYKSLNKQVFQDDFVAEVYDADLHSTYWISKSWKIKKNASSNLFNNNVKTIVISDILSFFTRYSSSYNPDKARKKIDFFLKLFSSTKNLEVIIFNLSKNKDDELGQEKTIYFKQFLNDLFEELPHIKIFIKINEIEKVLSNKQDAYRIHLIYLLSYLVDNRFFNNNIKFLDIDNKTLEKLYLENRFNEIDELVLVDDPFYNSSKYTKDIDFIFSTSIGKIQEHFPYVMRESYKKNSSLETFRAHKDIFRIIDFDSKEFILNKSKLILLVKKNKIDILKDKEFKKLFIYFGNSIHSVTRHCYDKKKFKANSIFHDANSDLNEINYKKLNNLKNQITEDLLNSSDLVLDDTLKQEFRKPLDTNIVIQDLGIEKNNFQELTHCWFEGVNPWLGKFVVLRDLDKLIPTSNLEYLRLSDCLAFDSFELPKLDKLKFLRLDFHSNYYREKIDPSYKNELNKFSNLPNLNVLEIGTPYNTFSNDLIKASGFTEVANGGNWNYVDIDFSDIHKLTKLKKLKIDSVDSVNLNKIKFLPAVEELEFTVFHLTPDSYPDDEKKITDGVVDVNFTFLKQSKNLRKFTLSVGDKKFKDPYDEYVYFEKFYDTYYKGNGDFINYINHNITELDLNINLKLNNQLAIQDIINQICNRFLKLEILKISFCFAADSTSYDFKKEAYNQDIKEQVLDIKKFVKLKNLVELSLRKDTFVKYKTINFEEIINLKKIRSFDWDMNSINFEEFRRTRKLFKEEKYDNPSYYDDYYEDETEEGKKNWSRFDYINNTEFGDFWSLEQTFIDREKKENKKNYKKDIIIKKIK